MGKLGYCHSGGGRNRAFNMPIVILLSCIAPGMASAATPANLRTALTSALGNYCIPKDESSCSLPSLALYNAGKSKCECQCDDMRYDDAGRKCVECEYGSTGRFATSCKQPTCPAGQFWQDFASGCPAGFFYRDDTAPCPAGMFMLATAARTCAGGLNEATAACPSGYYRHSY
jgi:hypothetical protein